MMQIGALIRAARDAQGMTQRDLAEKMRVSASAVAQWETDATNPSIKRRADLARILKIPFAELLPEAGNANPMTISDPQVLAFVRLLLQLPPQLREAYLMGAAQTLAMYLDPLEKPGRSSDC